jgi:hypothetical protein
MSIPGMDCSVDRIANYVSCYASAIGSKEEASRRFVRLINELQAVLPSDRWRGEETHAEIDAIRSYTYEDRNCNARIDIDLIGKLEIKRRLFLPHSNFRVGRDGTTTLMTKKRKRVRESFHVRFGRPRDFIVDSSPRRFAMIITTQSSLTNGLYFAVHSIEGHLTPMRYPVR